jgi:anti-sigma regulatory factor (Ser/Thr protein kinase)
VIATSEEVAVRAVAANAGRRMPKGLLAGEPTESGEAEVAPDGDGPHVSDLVCKLSLTFELSNDPADMAPVLRELEQLVSTLGLAGEHDGELITAALREALVNAVDHGNLELDSALKEQGTGAYERLAEKRRREAPYCDRRVHVHADFGHEQVRYVVRDEGKGFEPDSVSSWTDDLDLDREHGWGLLLIRAVMDEVSYNDAGNEITMVRWRKPDSLR